MPAEQLRQHSACANNPPFEAHSPFASWPQFGAEETDAVRRVLESGRVNYWTGDEGRRFEEEFAALTGCKHAIALTNGTAALELALWALEIGPGDEVIVPCRTFIASASCVVARGARPVMCDVDGDSQTLTRETIEPVLTPRTRAIIAVHLAGWPCDMDPIIALARERGIAVIEDCAQATGAAYKQRPVGSIGDAGCFSFCQDKIITTGGEGGMLVTNRTDLWEKAWRFKDNGKDPEAFYKPSAPGAQFRWLHSRFGANLRMTEMQSAIGRVLLKKLPEWLEFRRKNAARLIECCAKIPALRTPVPPADVTHSYYKFYTFARPDKLADGWNGVRVIEQIRAHGVPCFSGSCSEIYLEDAFPPAWRPKERLPVARELGETSLMFLVHPTLTDENISRTCDAIHKIFRIAGHRRSLNSASAPLLI